MSDAYTEYDFEIGDLVTFVGYKYSPDYAYVTKRAEMLGVILGTVPGYLSNIMYEIYWFKRNKVEIVVIDNIKLVHRAP